MKCKEGCVFFEAAVTKGLQGEGRCEIKLPAGLDTLLEERWIWGLDEVTGCDLGRPKKE
ncbi:hypothetical protein LCGC14_0355450 [marine sediment metagenome]|uniref:Uncharacterized protein n=1 Tax=marine sediment metagenome TaxID=412755 RepID=A0A0F9T9T3_9ZZZZ